MNKTIKVKGRITPKYEGYFVSLWKKIEDKNTPYSIDEIDYVLVNTINGKILLDKDYLIKNNILRSDTCKGKLGFRIKKEDSIKFFKE